MKHISQPISKSMHKKIIQGFENKYFKSYYISLQLRPQSIDNYVKEVLGFMNGSEISTSDNLSFWNNISSFIAKLLKANKEVATYLCFNLFFDENALFFQVTLSNLFSMDTVLAEKFGFILKAVEQNVLFLFFKRYFNSESFTPVLAPQLLCKISLKTKLEYYSTFL